MRVLVTGGAGFLGSHLVERLIERGDDVVVLDDLSTGRIENLAGCARRVRLEIGCVTDGAAVARLAKGADRIVHLASTVGVERVAAEPELTARVIGDGTEAVLDAARRLRTPTIIVSSSEVYGFTPPMPIGEDDLPGSIAGEAPRLEYARAKLAADRRAVAAASDSPVLVVRPFNLVGPRQCEDGGAVLPRFVASALGSAPLLVHGDGSQRRTLLDVRDAAGALARLVLNDHFPFTAVNLGGVEERSMLELAREVVSRSRSRSSIRLIAPPRSRGGVEVARRVPSLTRLAALVPGFAPRPLSASIDSVIAHLAERAAAVAG